MSHPLHKVRGANSAAKKAQRDAAERKVKNDAATAKRRQTTEVERGVREHRALEAWRNAERMTHWRNGDLLFGYTVKRYDDTEPWAMVVFRRDRKHRGSGELFHPIAARFYATRAEAKEAAISTCDRSEAGEREPWK